MIFGFFMITEHKFGSFVVDGKKYLGDMKILDSLVRFWDRRKHTVSFEDIKDILDKRPEVFVIGTGNSGYLVVPPEIRDYIYSRRIALFIDTNEKAIQKYNDSLLQNKRTCALFHATC